MLLSERFPVPRNDLGARARTWACASAEREARSVHDPESAFNSVPFEVHGVQRGCSRRAGGAVRDSGHRRD
jgi:hypothetical protein